MSYPIRKKSLSRLRLHLRGFQEFLTERPTNVLTLICGAIVEETVDELLTVVWVRFLSLKYEKGNSSEPVNGPRTFRGSWWKKSRTYRVVDKDCDNLWFMGPPFSSSNTNPVQITRCSFIMSVTKRVLDFIRPYIVTRTLNKRIVNLGPYCYIGEIYQYRRLSYVEYLFCENIFTSPGLTS